MLDKYLAELYGVTTGNLNKAVKRNLKRFPEDFMMQLEAEEFKDLLFQNGRSSWGGTRTMPYGFTEQGVAMLSSVLNSDRAIEVNKDSVFLIAPYNRILHESIIQLSDEQKKAIFIELTQSNHFERTIEFLIFHIELQSKKDNFIQYALDKTRAKMEDSYFQILQTLANRFSFYELNDVNYYAFKNMLKKEFQFLESNKANIPNKWNSVLKSISEIINKPEGENK